MRHFDDLAIERALGNDPAAWRAAVDAMAAAFGALAEGGAAVQARARTEAAGTKLSTMGAVIPAMGYAGAKVYTTVQGRFAFVILLFDAADGRLLAGFDAAALTRVRTSAVSALAARHLAREDARVLTVFGTGVQAEGHVPAMLAVRPIREVRVVSRGDASGFCARIERDHGIRPRQLDARAALAGADIIATTTRAATPLFDSADVPDGAFIAAVGATRPDTAEIDVDTVARCSVVALEQREQCRHEAGELMQAAAAGRLDWSRTVELAELVAGRVPGRRSRDELTMFESVGLGLEDVAIAALAYRRLTA